MAKTIDRSACVENPCTCHDDSAWTPGTYKNGCSCGCKWGKKKPKVKLTGIDGNVFNIIGTVARALRNAGQPDAAAEFSKQAFASQSYDAVLQLCFKYVDVRQEKLFTSEKSYPKRTKLIVILSQEVVDMANRIERK